MRVGGSEGGSGGLGWSLGRVTQESTEGALEDGTRGQVYLHFTQRDLLPTARIPRRVRGPRRRSASGLVSEECS